MKPAPTYWWDFDHDASCIIVQSDYLGGERLAEFWFPMDESADAAISKAEFLIDDYRAGRKTPQWRKNS